MPRKFTPEYPPGFRSEAVRLVRDGGRSISAAAKDLGVSAESLRHPAVSDPQDLKIGEAGDQAKIGGRIPVDVEIFETGTSRAPDTVCATQQSSISVIAAVRSPADLWHTCHSAATEP